MRERPHGIILEEKREWKVLCRGVKLAWELSVIEVVVAENASEFYEAREFEMIILTREA